MPLYEPSLSQWSLEARLLRWLTLLWLLLGLVIMFSASYAVADQGVEQDGFYYIKRQLLFLFFGLLLFNAMVHTPLKNVLKLSSWFLGGLLLLIFATLVLGQEVNGATRWLALGPLPPIQPSELIKPFLVLECAKLFGRWYHLPWSARLWRLGVFCLVLGGILLQPNLSTTALCGMTIWLIAMAGGVPFLYLGLTAVLGGLTATLSIRHNPYQLKRILTFLDPWQAPLGDGYQLVQSLLAVGSGGWWGTGFGLSQQKLFYLPIQYTDFIFAVYAEEFGWMGGLALMILLVSYGTLALIVALQCQHSIKRLVAVGVMVLLVGQSLLNIAVATGALPTTGLPLPLFSYGGSSLLASMTLAGLLIRVARENQWARLGAPVVSVL